MTEHKIYAYEQDFLEDGETAICTCGWHSRRGTLRQITAWHKNHVAEQGSVKEPTEDSEGQHFIGAEEKPQ